MWTRRWLSSSAACPPGPWSRSPERVLGMSGATPRYVLKPDPHSSHSIILRWLGEGHGRRLLDVGAADALISRQLTERPWRVTAIEGDPAPAHAGAPHCEQMSTAHPDRHMPRPARPFDAIRYQDAL